MGVNVVDVNVFLFNVYKRFFTFLKVFKNIFERYFTSMT